jgi:hypothetical protein
MDDRMALLAVIVSRSEALVMVSMLQAAGIDVHVGALHHASVEVNSLALGHYRVSVSRAQYEDASAIVAETFAASEWHFSEGLQTAVIKLILAWMGSISILAGISMFYISTAASGFLWLMPLQLIYFPVNPQGRSDYYLFQEKDEER